jgi:hypothetical protein
MRPYFPEDDSNDDEPEICRLCDHCGEDCGRDPCECDDEAAERAAEERFEAMREAWD